MSNKRPAVVLTYHRLTDEKTAKSKFHDLPFDRFRKQMQMVAERTQANTTPLNICISFDDGTCDHLAAGDLLSELGLTGTFFIIAGRLGQEGYLTRDQVRHLAQNGHRIGSHTVSHPHLTKLNSTDLDDELNISKRLLENLTGQTVDWLAPPGGIYNQAVVDRAMELGYSVVRTMEWGYADWPLKGRTPCFPILPMTTSEAFKNTLDGEASVWPYVVKTYLKKVVPEAMFGKLRDRLSKFQRITQKPI